VLEMNKKIHEYGAATYVQLFHVGPWMPPPMTMAGVYALHRRDPAHGAELPGRANR